MTTYLSLVVEDLWGLVEWIVVVAVILFTVAWPIILFSKVLVRFKSAPGLQLLVYGAVMLGSMGLCWSYYTTVPTEYASELGWRHIEYEKPSTPPFKGSDPALAVLDFTDYHGLDRYPDLDPVVHYNLRIWAPLDSWLVLEVFRYDQPEVEDGIWVILAHIAYMLVHFGDAVLTFLGGCLYSWVLSWLHWISPWSVLAIVAIVGAGRSYYLLLEVRSSSMPGQGSDALQSLSSLGVRRLVPGKTGLMVVGLALGATGAAWWFVDRRGKDAEILKQITTLETQGRSREALLLADRSLFSLSFARTTLQPELETACSELRLRAVRQAADAGCFAEAAYLATTSVDRCGADAAVESAKIVIFDRFADASSLEDDCWGDGKAIRELSALLLSHFWFGGTTGRPRSPDLDRQLEKILYRYGGTFLVGPSDAMGEPRRAVTSENSSRTFSPFSAERGAASNWVGFVPPDHLFLSMQYFVGGTQSWSISAPCEVQMSVSRPGRGSVLLRSTAAFVGDGAERCVGGSQLLVHDSEKHFREVQLMNVVYHFSFRPSSLLRTTYRPLLKGPGLAPMVLEPGPMQYGPVPEAVLDQLNGTPSG